MSLGSWRKAGYSVVCTPQYTAVRKVVQFLGRRFKILTEVDNSRRARHSHHSSKSTEDGSSTCPRKVGTYLQNYKASCTRCPYIHASQSLTSSLTMIVNIVGIAAGLRDGLPSTRGWTPEHKQYTILEFNVFYLEVLSKVVLGYYMQQSNTAIY